MATRLDDIPALQQLNTESADEEVAEITACLDGELELIDISPPAPAHPLPIMRSKPIKQMSRTIRERCRRSRRRHRSTQRDGKSRSNSSSSDRSRSTASSEPTLMRPQPVLAWQMPGGESCCERLDPDQPESLGAVPRSRQRTSCTSSNLSRGVRALTSAQQIIQHQANIGLSGCSVPLRPLPGAVCSRRDLASPISRLSQRISEGIWFADRLEPSAGGLKLPPIETSGLTPVVPRGHSNRARVAMGPTEDVAKGPSSWPGRFRRRTEPTLSSGTGLSKGSRRLNEHASSSVL